MPTANDGCYVPGLVNFGNTCFVNALLQALASCASYTNYVQLVTTVFQSSGLARLWKGWFNAPRLWAAKGPLVRSLADCMYRLQPGNVKQAADQTPASALEVLHALVQHKQKPFEHSDQQQDVCEALESMTHSIQREVNDWLTIQENPYADRQEKCHDVLTSRVFNLPTKTTESRVWRNLASGPAVTPSTEQAGKHLRRIVSEDPFGGLLAHSLQCTECGHTFTTQMNPFVALLVPVPGVNWEGRDLVVSPDVVLDDCLQMFFRSAEQGHIDCPKCSLLASVVEFVSVPTDPHKQSNVGLKQISRNSASRSRGKLYNLSATDSLHSSGSGYVGTEKRIQQEKRTDVAREDHNSTKCNGNGVNGIYGNVGGGRGLMNGKSTGISRSLPVCVDSRAGGVNNDATKEERQEQSRLRGGVYYQRGSSFDLSSFSNRGLNPVVGTGRTRLRWDVLKEVKQALVNDQFDMDTFDRCKRLLRGVNIEWKQKQGLVLARTLIGKLPKVLAISVQRRVYTSLGFNKIHGQIPFPQTIDVGDYMYLPSVHTCQFTLSSLVVHQGGQAGGHYVAARRVITPEGDVRWLMASDKRVRQVSERFVMEMECCLLLYEREDDCSREEEEDDDEGPVFYGHN
ncbi:hypothetical protein BSKO_13623 [Bryopsis sp. KO-2023]|nr:hypothetical protein BSKO_13623 [Bryopsis sp. KO-2023]